MMTKSLELFQASGVVVDAVGASLRLTFPTIRRCQFRIWYAFVFVPAVSLTNMSFVRAVPGAEGIMGALPARN
jgi:hypothetical protein